MDLPEADFYDERDLDVVQRAFHQFTDDQRGEEMVSDFIKEESISLWYTLGLIPLESTGDLPGRITYGLPKRTGYLTKLSLDIHLPEITVDASTAEGLTVKWRPGITYLIFRELRLYLNSQGHGKLSPPVLKIHRKFLDSRFREALESTNIDHPQTLEDLSSDNIPEHHLILRLPFWFTDEAFHAVYQDKGLPQAELVGLFDGLLGKLLLCQNASGETVPFNSDYLVGKIDKIPTPKIFAEFTQNHSIYQRYLKNCGTDRPPLLPSYLENHDDYTVLVTEKSGKPGDRLGVKIIEDSPIKGIFFYAEALEGPSAGRLNTQIIYGRSPIKCVSWEAVKGRRFKDLPMEFFETFAVEHFPTRGSEKGYGAIALNYASDSIDYQPGTVLRDYQVKLRFELRRDLPETSSFQIVVVLLEIFPVFVITYRNRAAKVPER